MTYRPTKPLGYDVRMCSVIHTENNGDFRDQEEKPWCYTCRRTAAASNFTWTMMFHGRTFLNYIEHEPTTEPCFTCGQNLGVEAQNEIRI